MAPPRRNEIYEAVIRRMVRNGLAQKEEAFAQAHLDDTDAVLLIYVRKCAAELGHSPHEKEIVGWKYLKKRFGTWETVLKRAYLPLPATPNRPSTFWLVQEEVETQKGIYRKTQARKREKSIQRRQEMEKKKRAAQK